MKSFLTYTAIIEALTGIGLLLFPLPLVLLLFGSPLSGESGKIIAWIAGAAILSFSFFCYYLRTDLTARKAVTAMLIYNLLLSVIFLYALLKQEVSGVGSLLVLIFHAFQSFRCFFLLRKKVNLSSS